jgi:phosphatidylinositol dimannoside acyltransferase
VRARLVLLAYTVGWAVVKALPEGLARRLFDAGADLAWRRQGKGARRLAANYRRVLGPDATDDQVATTARAGLRSYARYWREMFRLPVTPPQVVVDRMTCYDEHLLRTALAEGRGVVLALPHQGNWDHAGAWAVLTGMPFTTVAERLRPEALFDRFVAFRTSLGMEVVPLTGGERPPFELLAERLTAGGLLCLLGDRDLTARGIDVTFFGATARFPAGPAALALRTGAVLMPVTLWFEGERWATRIHPRVDHTTIAEMTQRVADAFEEGIRAHPEDWHMLQRLWLDDLDPSDPRRTAAPA